MKKVIFYVIPLTFMAFAFFLVSPVNVGAQTKELCPSITINDISYSLNPCSINIVMVDGKGNKDFSTSVIGKGSYGITKYGYGEGFPTYSILGTSGAGAFNDKVIDFYFNDNVLNADGNLPHVYEGTLPLHIFQGSERGDDNNFLRLKIKLTVIPDAPSITILSPDGGEELYAGTTTLITWDSYKFTENVGINLLNDDGVTINSVIASNVTNNGQYYWKIPSNISAGKYQISIGNSTTKDKSNQSFTIYSSRPSFKIIYPVRLQQLVHGKSYEIKWDTIWDRPQHVSSAILDLLNSSNMKQIWSVENITSTNYTFNVSNDIPVGLYVLSLYSFETGGRRAEVLVYIVDATSTTPTGTLSVTPSPTNIASGGTTTLSFTMKTYL